MLVLWYSGVLALSILRVRSQSLDAIFWNDIILSNNGSTWFLQNYLIWRLCWLFHVNNCFTTNLILIVLKTLPSHLTYGPWICFDHAWRKLRNVHVQMIINQWYFLHGHPIHTTDLLLNFKYFLENSSFQQRHDLNSNSICSDCH